MSTVAAGLTFHSTTARNKDDHAAEGHTQRWWGAITTLVALVVVVSTGGAVVYKRLEGRLSELESALAVVEQTQAIGAKQTDDVREKQTIQADQIAAIKSQVDTHPATSKVAKRAGRSVFTVFTSYGLGSALVVSNEGGQSTLLTNFHVVADQYTAGKRTVQIRRHGHSHPGHIVDVSQANDLAVIEVDGHLPALELATRRARVGDPVIVLGSPHGLGGTVTSGIVSAYRSIQEADYLQFSAPISPGNSGGPVLNETGKVLGVTVMKEVGDGAEGLGFGIPTARVCEALDVC